MDYGMKNPGIFHLISLFVFYRDIVDNHLR